MHLFIRRQIFSLHFSRHIYWITNRNSCPILYILVVYSLALAMLVHRVISMLRNHTMIMETYSKCVAPMFCLHSHKEQHGEMQWRKAFFFSCNSQIGGWDVKSRKAVSYHLKLLFSGFILPLFLVGFSFFFFCLFGILFGFLVLLFLFGCCFLGGFLFWDTYNNPPCSCFSLFFFTFMSRSNHRWNADGAQRSALLKHFCLWTHWAEALLVSGTRMN